MREFVFFVSAPKPLRSGQWEFSVASVRKKVHGPFDSQDEAFAARRALERRWRARLRSLGGAFRREWPDAWIIGVPEGVEVDGLPWVPEPEGRTPWRDPLGLRGGPWKIW